MKYPYQKFNPKNKPSFFQTKGKMKRYTFKRSGDFYSFDAGSDAEFIQGLREKHWQPMQDDNEMLKLMAFTYRESRQREFRFSSVSDFIEDCVKHGVMEVSDAERAR